MAKKTTHDAALSRLFGNVSQGQRGRLQKSDDAEAPGSNEPPGRAVSESKTSDAHRASRRPRVSQGRGGAMIAVESETTPGPSGYIGLGRYSRADGVVERITPYVRPDQAEALRIAVARKSDPRGTDVSQIIQSLLDEAGYRD